MLAPHTVTALRHRWQQRLQAAATEQGGAQTPLDPCNGSSIIYTKCPFIADTCTVTGGTLPSCRWRAKRVGGKKPQAG